MRTADGPERRPVPLLLTSSFAFFVCKEGDRSLYVVIIGKVYDVTEFLDGGLFYLTTTIFGLIADPS